jgi:hypothetical protein
MFSDSDGAIKEIKHARVRPLFKKEDGQLVGFNVFGDGDSLEALFKKAFDGQKLNKGVEIFVRENFLIFSICYGENQSAIRLGNGCKKVLSKLFDLNGGTLDECDDWWMLPLVDNASGFSIISSDCMNSLLGYLTTSQPLSNFFV